MWKKKPVNWVKVKQRPLGGHKQNLVHTRTAASSTASEKDLKWGQVHNEKTNTYNLASGESGGLPAFLGRKAKWLLSACTFIGRSHVRSLGNSDTGEFD